MDEDVYIVKPGDTMESIAEEFLGNPNLFPLLAQLNGVDNETIRPGMELLLHPEGLEPEK